MSYEIKKIIGISHGLFNLVDWVWSISHLVNKSLGHWVNRKVILFKDKHID